MDEKGLSHSEKGGPAVVAPTMETQGGEWREQESFMTRNGLNLQSFQRRPKGGALVALDKSMKTRHLHMIAIGGSIGAGFFVGSGGALNKGVSEPLANEVKVACSHSAGTRVRSY
jgi:amino acid transporter